MDSFFLIPTILSVVSFTIFCGCFCLCLWFAKKQGRFPTVNRNGPINCRVNRSGPTYGANRTAFGSGMTHNTQAYNEMVNDELPSVFIDNNLSTIHNNPPIGSTDATIVNTYGWNTNPTIADELPPTYAEATGLSAQPRHESQNERCDIGFLSHGNGDSGGKFNSDDTNQDGGACDTGGDFGGGGADSGGGGDTGGGDCGGGDTGCDSGGGGDTTTD